MNIVELQKGKSLFWGLVTKEGLYSIEIDKTKKIITPVMLKENTKNEYKKEFKRDKKRNDKAEIESHREKNEKIEEKHSHPTENSFSSSTVSGNTEINKETIVEIIYEYITVALQEKVQILLKKMGLLLSFKITKISERNYFVELYGEDNGIIIGKKGKTLNNFEYLLKSIFKKYRIEIDVEGFKEKRYDTLKKLSQKMAEKVSKTGKTMKLNPMPARERKIIHEVMNQYPQLDTFSEGREPNRFIIIKKKR
jgi:spoIIIJ-associated protein